jgi:O-acetyl-ADP-ribose deacetylase (regulator of RNase III)
MAGRMTVVQGDITKQRVDAIVNAANEALRGGGGVDGAIHRAAGPELLEECIRIGGCPTGEARITKGYRLPAKYVIHTVGPVWHGGDRGEPEKLAACYRNALRLAAENGARTVAFPGISTGVYGYPLEAATRLAMATVRDCLAELPEIEEVRFVTFGERATEVAERALAERQTT